MSAHDAPSAGSAPGPDAAAVTGPTDPEAIKAEIDQTREQLSRTVDELSRRLDVPTRAKEGFLRVRAAAVETYRASPPIVLGGAVTLVAATVGLVVWRGQRQSPRRRKRPVARKKHVRSSRRRR